MYKLLIVDDNYYDRIGLSELSEWKELGFSEIHMAEDGEDGLKKALELKPLLVITDVSMPVIDGITMARKIVEKLPATKFIFVSCFEDSKYIRDAIDVNAYGYILKPVNINKLISAAQKIMVSSRDEKNRDDKVLELEKKLKDQMPYLQERITRDLVYGEVEGEVNGQLAQFDMEILKFCAVAVLRLDSQGALSSVLDNAKIYLTMNSINDFLKEKIEGLGRVYSFVPNNYSVVVLLYIDKTADEAEATDLCFEYFEKIREKINTDLKSNVDICIGGVSRSVSEIHELYKKAEQALDVNLCAKPNSIMLADDSDDENLIFSFDFKIIKKELKELFDNCDIDKCEKWVDKYYNNTEVVSEKVIKEFTLSIVCTVQLILFEMNKNINDIFGEDYVIWEKLSKFNTIFDIRQWLFNILKGVIEHLAEMYGERNVQIANKLKKIIEEQYLELENVSRIAQQAYVSTVYANYIFKNVFGCTMFDYLTKVKIEKAKEMLKKQDIKVYEIASLLGYKSKAYFTSLFKEYTGVTPKEYRQIKE